MPGRAAVNDQFFWIPGQARDDISLTCHSHRGGNPVYCTKPNTLRPKVTPHTAQGFKVKAKNSIIELWAQLMYTGQNFCSSNANTQKPNKGLCWQNFV